MDVVVAQHDFLNSTHKVLEFYKSLCMLYL